MQAVVEELLRRALLLEAHVQHFEHLQELFLLHLVVVVRVQKIVHQIELRGRDVRGEVQSAKLRGRTVSVWMTRDGARDVQPRRAA